MTKIILISIPILFIIGSLLHYAYAFFNNSKLIGIFTPVNESIFEHSKLLLTPLILFWGMLFLFVKNNINYNSFFFAMLISIVVSIATMIAFYYTYKGSLGNNYELMNILDLLVSLIVGQVVASHVYTYSYNVPYYFSIALIVIIFALFIYLTFKPIKIPLFFDKKSKTFGINKNKES